ncbi:orotidine-5'-phosphate decarboxylase [Dongia deserti]|uniref:orotidine-5'-phosphate decarboxylase n=1 Tax=Dongia deserti TaxID=2268030 RepID=UPI000E65C32C|nr:orotidine-5'-phosphate decarboxylase [Dongia deserti]
MARGILVALDTTEVAVAAGWARATRDSVAGVKLGLEFFNARGPAGVAEVAALGAPLFLDLKFHDIPNTVAGAVRAVAPLRPMILNLHASGGAAMMKAARDAARDAAARLGSTPPKLIGVTVLTSLSDEDLAQVGQHASASDQVRRLAALTKECGLDGVVCSPHEIAVLRRDLGPDFLLVTPGVRPAWAAAGDQKRVMEPRQAMEAGADYLVVGRPITGAADPAEAARRIQAEIAGVAA